MADKKKSTRKSTQKLDDAATGPDPSQRPDPEEAADDATEEETKPVDSNSVVQEGPDAEAEDLAVDEDLELPDRPSSKQVLNRLLEKNEIILKLNKDNAEKDKQLKELNEKWLRSVAEFENYRKRTRKEWELLKQQSRTEVILEILGTIDDFERAFSVVEDEDDEFVQGIKLIYNNLLSVLEKFGVQPIESHHRSFDPSLHMAVGQLETEEVESGHIAEVIQKGYRLDDTVIRPARVIVAK